MAYDTVVLKNPNTGQIKEAPLGFSWTMFFFGIFPPMFRGDWKWVGIVFFVGFGLALVSFGLLTWLPALVGSFVWNKSHLNDLIGKGYKIQSVASGNYERLNSALGYEPGRLDGASLSGGLTDSRQ